jgi:hypothetical protein
MPASVTRAAVGALSTDPAAGLGWTALEQRADSAVQDGEAG